MKNNQEETTSRTARRKEQENKQKSQKKEKKDFDDTTLGKFLTNKWVYGGVLGLTILTFIVSGILLVAKTKQVKEKEALELGDYSAYFTDIDYTIRLVEEEEEVIGFIVSEEMELTDAVKLSEAIRKDAKREVRLFVYEIDTKATVAPEFHEEGLLYSVKTFPDNHFESQYFYNMPKIESNVDGVAEWSINNEKSHVDSKNVLHISGEVPTLTTTEETIAFLKGFDRVVTDLNEESYDNRFYTIDQGLSTLRYSANHPQVIADIELYQLKHVQ